MLGVKVSQKAENQMLLKQFESQVTIGLLSAYANGGLLKFRSGGLEVGQPVLGVTFP